MTEEDKSQVLSVNIGIKEFKNKEGVPNLIASFSERKGVKSAFERKGVAKMGDPIELVSHILGNIHLKLSIIKII